MTRKELAAKIVSRIFDSDLRRECVSNLCYEAREYGFAGVQVFPIMIGHCKQILTGTPVKIGSVVTYPHGIFPAGLKVFEAKDCVAEGADEVVVSMNCIALNSGMPVVVEQEMRAVREALPHHIVKFILETEFLREDKIVAACEAAVAAGIDCLVTSTGLYNTLDEQKNDVPIRTAPEEVTLIKGVVGDKVKIQAQGNIDSAELAAMLIDAGADYIGTRHAVRICCQLA